MKGNPTFVVVMEVCCGLCVMLSGVSIDLISTVFFLMGSVGSDKVCD